MARASAVKAKTQAINQIQALLVDGPEELRRRLGTARGRERAGGCARLQPTTGTETALRSLGRRRLHLDEEVRDLDRQIKALVEQVAPALLTRPGIGIHWRMSRVSWDFGGGPMIIMPRWWSHSGR